MIFVNKRFRRAKAVLGWQNQDSIKFSDADVVKLNFVTICKWLKIHLFNKLENKSCHFWGAEEQTEQSSSVDVRVNRIEVYFLDWSLSFDFTTNESHLKDIEQSEGTETNDLVWICV